MSHTTFELEDGLLFDWKDCEVSGCTNQVCLGRSDKWCWPHLMSGGEAALKPRSQNEPLTAMETKQDG